MVSARRLLVVIAITLGAGAWGALGACNAVLAIPDPTLVRHVTCVDGKCTCEVGFADCDGTPGDDCATDLGNDPHHCGACGRDCQGGGCKGGLCQPLVLATIPGARGLSMHGGSLLVGRCGGPGPSDTFLEVPPGGGEAVTLVRSNHCAAAQAIAGDALYWGDTSALLGILFSQPLVPGLVASTSAWKVVAKDGFVYWGVLDAMGKSAGLMRLKLDGSKPEMIFATEVRGIAADANKVFWIDGNGVHALPDGMSSELGLFNPLISFEIAADATNLYLAAQAGIHALPIQGGTLSLLVPGARGAHLATDATTLFWLDDLAGTVSRVPLAGGAPTVLASGLSSTGTSAIAVDEKFVYCLAGDKVGRIPR